MLCGFMWCWDIYFVEKCKGLGDDFMILISGNINLRLWVVLKY